MAAQFEVCQLRAQKMTFSGTGSNNQRITVTWEVDFSVEVTGVDPAYVGAYEVLSAPGIPIVNRSIYWTDTTILPFVICKDKTAERVEGRLSRWIVKTKWSTPQRDGGGSSEEDDNVAVPLPVNCAALPAKITVSLGEHERVLYKEKTRNGSREWEDVSHTPTGNWWAQPVMERIALFQMKLTQHESFISYEDMLDRKFKVNKKAWYGREKEQWLIEDVEAQDVRIKTTTGYEDCALVTYTIVLAADDLTNHDDVRGLFDTQYLNDAGELVAFNNDEPGTSKVGYIDIDGKKRADQTGEPDYVYYKVYDEIDFDDFLKTPS